MTIEQRLEQLELWIGAMEASPPQVVLGHGAIYIFDEKAVMVGEVLVVSLMA